MRNQRLTEIAGRLRQQGLDAAEIEPLLLVHPERRGLPTSEVQSIARSIGKKPPGQPYRRREEVATLPPMEQLASLRGWKAEALGALGCRAGVGKFRSPIVEFPLRGAEGRVLSHRRRRADNSPFWEGGPKALSEKGKPVGLVYTHPLPRGGIVLVCEGEADTAAALSAGHAATVGTPSANLGDECRRNLATLLAGREVVLAPDPDPAGVQWRETITGMLHGVGCTVRFIPPDPKLGDLDKRLQRMTPEERGPRLQELIRTAVSVEKVSPAPAMSKPPAKIPAPPEAPSPLPEPPPDPLAAAEQLAAGYGLTWREFQEADCSLDGGAVVYPIRLHDDTTVRKMKGIAAAADGTRPAWGDIGSGFQKGLFCCPVDSLKLGTGLPLALCASEEAAMVAFIKTGCPACSPADGALGLSPETARMMADARPCHVVIAFDDDDAGRKSAFQCARLLRDADVQEIRTVVWPDDAPQGYDLTDHLMKHGLEAVRELLEKAEPMEAQIDNAPATEEEDTEYEYWPRISDFDNPPPPPRWLVTDILQEGAFVLMAGPGGSHKTNLGLDIAVSVASGRAWLDTFEVPSPGHVMFYSADTSPTTIKRRIWAFCQGRKIPTAEIRGRLDLVPRPPRPLNLTFPEQVKNLIREIRRSRTCLVVIDCLAKIAAGADENSASEMAVVMDGLRVASEATGAAIILLHHAGKPGKNGEVTAYRGSSTIRDNPDFNLQIVRVSHDRVRLTQDKQRDAMTPPIDAVYEFKHEPDGSKAIAWCRFRPVAPGNAPSDLSAAAGDARDQALVEAFLDYLKKWDWEANPAGPTTRTMTGAVQGRCEVKQRVLRQMTTQGLIQTAHGKGLSIHYVLPAWAKTA